MTLHAQAPARTSRLGKMSRCDPLCSPFSSLFLRGAVVPWPRRMGTRLMQKWVKSLVWTAVAPFLAYIQHPTGHASCRDAEGSCNAVTEPRPASDSCGCSGQVRRFELSDVDMRRSSRSCSCRLGLALSLVNVDSPSLESMQATPTVPCGSSSRTWSSISQCISASDLV